jgi:hypothetical protein
MTASPDALTFVSAEPSLAKRITVVDGVVTRADDPPWPRIVAFQTLEIRSPDDLLDVLRSAAEDSPAPCVVRADPLAEMGRRAIYDDRDLGPAGLRIMPRSWVGYDIEKVPAGDIDPLHEPERAVAKARRCLHPAHHDASVVWQITARPVSGPTNYACASGSCSTARCSADSSSAGTNPASMPPGSTRSPCATKSSRISSA